MNTAGKHAMARSGVLAALMLALACLCAGLLASCATASTTNEDDPMLANTGLERSEVGHGDPMYAAVYQAQDEELYTVVFTKDQPSGSDSEYGAYIGQKEIEVQADEDYWDDDEYDGEQRYGWFFLDTLYNEEGDEQQLSVCELVNNILNSTDASDEIEINVVFVGEKDNLIEAPSDLSYLFYSYASDEDKGITSIDISGLDTSRVTVMTDFFEGCNLSNELGLYELDMSNATNISGMFENCSGLESLDLSRLNTSKVTDMSNLFAGCSGVECLDLSKLDTSNVRNMSALFARCSGIESLDLSKLKMPNVTEISGMFSECSELKSIDLSVLDTSKVTDMSYLFSECSGLESLDLSKLDTSQATNISGMFQGCSGLKYLDVSVMDTSKVRNMSYLFFGCSGLKYLDLSELDTSEVVATNCMFYGCSELESINLAGLNMPQVQDMDKMFCNCGNLKAINMSGLVTSVAKIELMYGMFSGCTSLTYIDLSWLSSVEEGANLNHMFKDCTKLTAIDLSGIVLDTTNRAQLRRAVYMGSAYENCPNLQSIALHTGSKIDFSLDALLTTRFSQRSNVVCESTNPSVVSVEQSHIIANEKGLALLMFTDKKNPDVNAEYLSVTVKDPNDPWDPAVAWEESQYAVMPVTIEEPATSETPTEPDPAAPGTDPAAPGTDPAAPGTDPAAPGTYVVTPENPTTSEDPASSTTDATNPTPATPGSPDAADATDSNNPSGAADATDPDNPSGAADATDPDNPSDTADATDPDNPSGAADATDPNSPNASSSATGNRPGSASAGATHTSLAALNSLAKAKIKVKSRAWTGKKRKPTSITVTLNGKMLKKGIDYTATCKGGKTVGGYKVVIMGKGAYTGAKLVKFNIVPKAVKGVKVTGTSKGLSVTWKKPAKKARAQVKGYQVRCSAYKSMKKAAKVKVKGAKKTTAAVSKLKGGKKLKAGKKYYVQVRAYKTVKGKTYYSSWSKAKAIKLKR